MKRAKLAVLAGCALPGAVAQAELLCPGQDVVAIDGRMLGHIGYDEARTTDLVAAPSGFAVGAPCQVRPEVAYDLARMLAAANADPQVKGRLRGISCYRSVAHQRRVFCSAIGPKKRARDAADRARFVGPPGYSEHATGYAIDFGTRPSPGCGDVNACFGATAAGRWLLAHGPEFGFELSFPAGNAQGVSWEPWHWRWVGTSLLIPGAAAARTTFAAARTAFPARPTTGDSAARLPSPGAAPGFSLPQR